MRFPIDNQQQQTWPYLAPFSHNTSVTDRRTDDDNRDNSSTLLKYGRLTVELLHDILTAVVGLVGHIRAIVVKVAVPTGVDTTLVGARELMSAARCRRRSCRTQSSSPTLSYCQTQTLFLR